MFLGEYAVRCLTLPAQDRAGPIDAIRAYRKAMSDGAATMARKVAAQVWELTDGGRIPLVCDASSCTHGITGIGELVYIILWIMIPKQG